ncbi:hypothetical protein M407DRAFT_72279, partial [Tulasnella calospora MUT 4182]
VPAPKPFAHELSLLSEFCHENIVALSGFVEDMANGIAWLVIPWEANGNVREFIASRKWEVPERIYDITRGIQYLHCLKSPICHGDLKSLNILVNSKNRAIITDFGSARVMSEFKPAVRGPGGGPAWSLRWAAPELLGGADPSLASDIWASGWIFWEIMTGKFPFSDINKDAIIVLSVLQGDLPRVIDNTHVSPMKDLCSLILECWQPVPENRPSADACQGRVGWMVRVLCHAWLAITDC